MTMRTEKGWGWLAVMLAVPALFLLMYRLDELPQLDLDEGGWLLTAMQAYAGGDAGRLSSYSLPVLRWWALPMLHLRGGPDLLLLRLLPVLLTVALLALLWHTARAWHGGRVALFVLAAAAYSPFTIVWGRLFRSPYLLSAIINILILRAAFSERSWSWRITVVGALFIAAGLLHPAGLALLPGLAILGAITIFRERRRGAWRAALTGGLALVALLALVLAYNAELLQRVFMAEEIAARLQQVDWHTALARAGTIALGAMRINSPGWVIGGLGYGYGVWQSETGDQLALLIAALAMLAALAPTPGPGRQLLAVYAAGVAAIAVLLFASRHLGYAWALEDPQMQRFLIPLAPLLFLMLGRMLGRCRIWAGVAGLIVLLAVWLPPVLSWLGSAPPATARGQWHGYAAAAAALAAAPATTLYTDSWEAYIWLQALGGETPRIRLLRQEHYSPGYLQVFLDSSVRWSEIAERQACARPGWYMVRSADYCSVPARARREKWSGGNLQLFVVAAGGDTEAGTFLGLAD